MDPGPAPVVAVIGPVGAGKSAVLGFLQELGAATINFDDYSRQLLRPDRPETTQVRTAFGPHYVEAGGKVDRAALGALVFADDQAREQLEGILHPPMLAQLRAAVEEFRRDPSAPLLAVEGAILGRLAPELFDALVQTTAPANVRVERLRSKGWSPETIQHVLALQRRLGLDTAAGDFVIDGSRPLSDVREQVVRLWHDLTGCEGGN
ncbi:MAG: dephospho-CoA kinase [candidate division WS1 bacterium]|nr:dephospho-CoA kinase [candidate division WS1 bacterium]